MSIENFNAFTATDTTGESKALALGYEAFCADIRQERDSLIAATDTWGLADYPATAEQTAYRQALRDITDQDGFPTNITWPTKP